MSTHLGLTRSGYTGVKRYHVARENGRLSAHGEPAVSFPSGLRQWVLDGKLHRPDGPAVETKYGTVWYYWRGVCVPKHVIMSPKSSSPAEILECPNVEIRRVWLEAYGLEDALIDLGRDGLARIIDETSNPPRRLWEISTQDVDERKPVYVQVQDPSTDRWYFLRVPPDMRTCHQAVASTFQLSTEEYIPVNET